MIVVLSLTKNTSLWNDALAYHMTMAGALGGGVNVGGGVMLVVVLVVELTLVVVIVVVVG